MNAPVSSNTNTAANNDDSDDENDNGSSFPLLAIPKIKMGPFSIKYSPRSSASNGRVKSYLNGGSSGNDVLSGSVYHDFTKSDEAELYVHNDDLDDDDERIAAYHHNKKHTSLIHQTMHKLHKSLFKLNISVLPLRILLLALYLAFTLSSFWILDSIKEPTLAILVDGDLGKHQPRAKMVSFVVVVGLAVGMEWVDRLRHSTRSGGVSDGEEGSGIHEANAALEQSWNDRNLPSSMQEGGRWIKQWKKMGVVQSSQLWKHFRWGRNNNNTTNDPEHDGEQPSSSKITTFAFYVVGSLYIHAFVTVAVALRQHPAFRPNAIFHEANDVAELQAGGVDAYPSSDFLGSDVDSGETSVGNEWYYPTLGYVLFALIESFGSVSITLFWAFANSHLTLEAAERHYGSIVAVAQAGAIGGSTLSAVMGSRRRSAQSVMLDEEGRVDATITPGEMESSDAQVTPMLIFFACGCIGLGMGIIALYAQLFSRPMSQGVVQTTTHHDAGRSSLGREGESSEELCQIQQHQPDKKSNSGGGLFGGLQMIFRYEYLKLVLAVSVLYEIALTCMHYELNLIGLDRFGVGISIVDESGVKQTAKQDEGITYIQFMGWYGQTVNILSLFLSFYAFPRLIKHYGLSTTIRIFPTFLLVVTICAFILFPRNLYFLFIALSLCKALTYSVHDPSEEVLYMPTSDDVKYRAKFWIDVVGQRVAKAFGSAINNYAGSVEGIVTYGSLPSIVASIALWLACYQVGILFNGLIKSGDVVGLEDVGDDVNVLEMRQLEDEDDDDSDDGNANTESSDERSSLFRDPEEDIPTPSFHRRDSGSATADLT